MTPQQSKQFRSIGHQLKPIVIINSMSENVLAELQRALADHELIKIRLGTEDRNDKQALLNELLQASGAVLVQQIGKVALLYKATAQPDPRLSNLQRYKHLLDD